jgi:tRNA nucleotidyltransferase (CCA-adding enzyme)
MEDKRLFNEIEKALLEDDKPSVYLNELEKKGILSLSYPFKMLTDLIKIEQSPVHHPEGNVWIHTLMVVDEAAKKKDLSEHKRAFMWAALLHDIGKAPTTKLRKGKLTSYDHDKVGQKMAVDFLKEFTEDKDLIKRVSVLVRWHMQILFVVKDLPFVDIEAMASNASIDEIALLSLCDRMGRGEMTKEKVTEEQRNIEIFLKKCKEFMERRKEPLHV